MGAMRTHNPKITSKARMLIYHVPEYVRRTGIQFGSISEQAPKSQHTFFDIFYYRFKENCINSPVFQERLLNDVLH